MLRAAIAEAAAGIIVVHNHSSGGPAPSTEGSDRHRQLAEAGRKLDLPLYDHVVIERPLRQLRDGRPALALLICAPEWQTVDLVVSLPGEYMMSPRTGRLRRLGLGLCAVMGLAITPGVAHGQG